MAIQATGSQPQYIPQQNSQSNQHSKVEKSNSDNERTALQKHVDFFDRDGDTQITVPETYQGLRALGLDATRSLPAAVVINLGLGKKTEGSTFVVNSNSIHLGKHPSDTDIYDDNGKFSQAKFDELYEKYDTNQDGNMSKEEFVEFRARNKEDGASAIASKLEFDLLVELGGTHTTVDGEATQVFSKERLKEFYDGSLFPSIEAERTNQSGPNKLRSAFQGLMGGMSAGAMAGFSAMSLAKLPNNAIMVGTGVGVASGLAASVLTDNQVDSTVLGAVTGAVTGGLAFGKLFGAGKVGIAAGLLVGAAGGFIAHNR